MPEAVMFAFPRQLRAEALVSEDRDISFLAPSMVIGVGSRGG